MKLRIDASLHMWITCGWIASTSGRMCGKPGNLWITTSTPETLHTLHTRGFLRDSTSDKHVVPYSRLLSTELSTVSTGVNTVKELIQFKGDPITRRWGKSNANPVGPRRRDTPDCGASMGSPALAGPMTTRLRTTTREHP